MNEAEGKYILKWGINYDFLVRINQGEQGVQGSQ